MFDIFQLYSISLALLQAELDSVMQSDVYISICCYVYDVCMCLISSRMVAFRSLYWASVIAPNSNSTCHLDSWSMHCIRKFRRFVGEATTDADLLLFLSWALLWLVYSFSFSFSFCFLNKSDISYLKNSWAFDVLIHSLSAKLLFISSAYLNLIWATAKSTGSRSRIRMGSIYSTSRFTKRIGREEIVRLLSAATIVTIVD